MTTLGMTLLGIFLYICFIIGGSIVWIVIAEESRLSKKYFRGNLEIWFKDKLCRFGIHFLMIPIAPVYWIIKRKEIVNFR